MQKSNRDFQRQRVYDWELDYIRPLDKTLIKLESAQPIVDYIWRDMGLVMPPKVVPIDERTSRWLGAASRSHIELQPEVSNVVILHEVSHSLIMDLDGDSGGPAHGPRFVGMFYKLLEKYLQIPGAQLLYTLERAGVKYDLSAQPTF